MRVGVLVGAGRTADVFAFGAGSVVKLLRPGIPVPWAGLEASLTAAVHARGLPTPAVRDVVEVDGRPGIVFERIEGPSMWSRMSRSAAAAVQLARTLARMHLELQAELAPDGLPSLIDRVVEKTALADALTERERSEAGQTARALGSGRGLYHGDMHPGNVLMSPRGPVVIDWFDAAAGAAIADVVRTSLLIRPPPAGRQAPPHLPGATAELLCALHYHYLETVMAERAVPASLVRRWESVLAASRLAERAEPDDAQLLALWRDRGHGGERTSPLLSDLRALAALADDGLQ